jgi:hypothetical protein
MSKHTSPFSVTNRLEENLKAKKVNKVQAPGVGKLPTESNGEVSAILDQHSAPSPRSPSAK